MTAFFSFSAQKAAYPYSLIPFIGLLAIFAGRGIFALFVALRGAASARIARKALVIAAVTVVGVGLIVSLRKLEELREIDNRYQISVLRDLDRLTARGDPVYDNSGSGIDRPSVSFFFFTSAFLREQLWGYLSRDVPGEIIRSGCPATLRDLRFNSLRQICRAF